MELEQVQRTNPEKYEELIELRRLSPQLFRKELARLIKKGKIVKGRTFALHDEDLEVLELDSIAAVKEVVEERIASGRYDFRRLGGLLQQERQTHARPDFLAYLQERYDKLLEETGRHLH